MDKFKEYELDELNFSAYDITFSLDISRKEILSWINQVKNDQKNISDIQPLRQNSLFSVTHLKSSIWHAWHAFLNKKSISNNLSVEFLLYASGQRQISKAFDFLGIKQKENCLSFVIFHTKPLDIDEVKEIIGANFKDYQIRTMKLTQNIDKINAYCKFFSYDLQIEEMKNEHILKELEDYILTCISNLVFDK